MKTEVIIKQASKDDIDAILPLLDDVADKHGENRSDILKEHPRHIDGNKLNQLLCDRMHFLLIAKYEGKIVGVMNCKIKEICNDIKYKNCKIMQIEDTCVSKRFKRAGIGTLLLEKALFLAKEKDCSRVETTVWEFNKESFCYFQSNKFKVQRYIMEYDLYE